ncbi:CutA1 divalent ion tolerance protein [Desulfurispirillum indicum S5]|uniref:CutA1 divalent ion tolerance protein n=1 Tax=Desulfurispirillum indicum (strain ATCC BAA-1389 / DSM 22839 / S5) TaxID=653733 RepID=E6W5T0_DESIS|nr:divalent-cation tolerance protein CutA [Desulfurispirillum indicum]ADU67215.1 CutA1 divalent ion tolerance protein [Desulfurispirillum indicum S5]
MSATIVYMTAGSEEEARRIGHVLVEEKLAACVNILGGITSLYWWEGAVQEGGEVAFLAKTRPELVDELARRVVQLHSYDCPCVVSLPVAGGHPAFLQWIGESTR